MSPEVIIAVIMGLASAPFAVSKFIKTLKSDQADYAGHDALRLTIKSMTEEVARLAHQNTTLAMALNKAQTEALEIHTKLMDVSRKLASMPTKCPQCGTDLP